MSKAWLIRAGREAMYVEDFISNNVVAIGWGELGPIERGLSKEEIAERYHTAYPSESEAKARVGYAQIYRFLNEIAVGDTVLTYDRNKRLYHIGRIESEATWSVDTIDSLPRMRKATWTKVVPRDQLQIETINTLGAILTLFEVKANFVSDIMAHATTIDKLSTEPTSLDLPKEKQEERVVQEEQIREEFVEKVEESIEQRILSLSWDQMQNLVAGILRAMGYRTTVSARGSDRGVDIFASPDGLGLQEPRIFVEVKHRPGQVMGSQDLRSFIGGRSSGDKCLYVSTGGFSKEARYEADRAGIALRLIELVDLRKLIVDNYDRLDEETRSLVPLKRIYVLAT